MFHVFMSIENEARPWGLLARNFAGAGLLSRID